MAPAEAFALGDGPDACLLLHGFTGSPLEVRPVGEALSRAGMRCLGPLLPGHGTTPRDLFGKRAEDLVEAARAALASLGDARRVYVCGLSAGALLAVHLAAERPVAAVALLAPAISFSGATWLYTEIVGRLPALPILLSKGARDIAEVDDREKEPSAYAAVPMAWGRELRSLSSGALRLAPRVRAPALILQGGRDRTVSLAGARKLAAALGSPKPVDVRVFPRSGHVLPLDVDAEDICREVKRFFQGGD
jgi:carboxylesterase